ncbi:MAG: recombination mediator RecR [Candidatus Goldiibacteriota bacterium]
MYNYPHKLQKLINEISKLPGIGPKMAERAALHILKKDAEYIDAFRETLEDIKKLGFCSRCFNVSEGELCVICSDDRRDPSIICIVESSEDVVTIERTGKFNGYYHILQGLINPLNNMLPENLRIKELLSRLRKDPVKEMILALNHTVEGDATSMYISAMLRDEGGISRITRLAKGLPMGSDIRYADEITLGQAIMERKEI